MMRQGLVRRSVHPADRREGERGTDGQLTSDLGHAANRLAIGGFVLWGGSLAALGFVLSWSDSNVFMDAALLASVAAILPGAAGAFAAAAAVVIGLSGLALGEVDEPFAFLALAGAAVVLGRLSSSSLSFPQILSRFVAAHSIARHALVLEARAASELARARRHGHVLTLLTHRVDASPHQTRETVLAAARGFQSRLRITDCVGIDGDRVLVLLPETPGTAVSAICARLSSAPGLGSVDAVGSASFPDEEITWAGLQALAISREESPSSDLACDLLDAAGGSVGERSPA